MSEWSLGGKLLGTSKNYPFGFWTDLLSQQCVLKSPQYTKYSGLSKTFAGTKSLAQNTKKWFLEVAKSLSLGWSCLGGCLGRNFPAVQQQGAVGRGAGLEGIVFRR